MHKQNTDSELKNISIDNNSVNNDNNSVNNDNKPSALKDDTCLKET